MSDRYELLDVIGSGGMATVWRARDTQLGRTVALKRPHPDKAESDVHERFRREARTAATVSHPNLVTVFDAGSDDVGPFLVMELVEAPSLAEVAYEHVDPVKLGGEIASALAVLHDRGIVHRDVKPANILVAESGAQLTDFGIARSPDDTAALTQAGTTFATPAYAAPEILRGEAHTAASDVYSLAAVLHEVVTGSRVMPDSDTQVLVVDEVWKPIVDDALSPDPARRPSAVEFGALVRAGTAVDPTGLIDTPADDIPADAPARILDSVDPVIVALPREPVEQNKRRLAIFLGALSVLAVVLIGVAIFGGDDADPAATAEPIIAQSDPVADPASESTAAPDTPAPTPETVPEEVVAALSEIDAARTDFVDFVAGLDESTITDKEAERLIEDVEDAIAARAAGDDVAVGLGVERQLDDAFDRIAKRINGADARDGALQRLARVIASLGIDPGEIILDL